MMLPSALSVNVGSGVGVDIDTEDFEPLVWMCDSRVVYDDATEPGRISDDGEELVERTQNYAFEGEQIQWNVLVMDKNGVQKINDVYVLVDELQGGGSQIITDEHEEEHCGGIPSTSTDWTDTITLPRFDASQGNLTGVELSFDADMESDISVEHLSTVNPANFSVVVQGNVSVTYSDVDLLADIFFMVGDEVDTFDGILDYNGTSGRTFPDVTGSDSVMQQSSNFNDFIENFPGETFNVDVDAQSQFELIGPGNYAFLVLTNASAQACVKYTYETTRIISIPGGEQIEANCVENLGTPIRGLFDTCNARILEEELEFDADVMRFYTCILTVETPLSMYGEYWFTVEAEDLDGLTGRFDENEYWFLNPIVALSIDGSIEFNEIRPGTHSYSETLLVGNDADDESGVQLDMFISGTDFYDSSSSGAACPDTNQLALGDGESDCDSDDPFCYFATHGAYDSQSDARNDAEGYVGINYGIGFNDPNPFYGAFNGDVLGYEIMQGLQVGPYFPGNVLVPGSEIALTFRLNLPEPCNGNFDSGSIYFWGEAI